MALWTLNIAFLLAHGVHLDVNNQAAANTGGVKALVYGESGRNEENGLASANAYIGTLREIFGKQQKNMGKLHAYLNDLNKSIQGQEARKAELSKENERMKNSADDPSVIRRNADITVELTSLKQNLTEKEGQLRPIIAEIQRLDRAVKFEKHKRKADVSRKKDVLMLLQKHLNNIVRISKDKEKQREMLERTIEGMKGAITSMEKKLLDDTEKLAEEEAKTLSGVTAQKGINANLTGEYASAKKLFDDTTAYVKKQSEQIETYTTALANREKQMKAATRKWHAAIEAQDTKIGKITDKIAEQQRKEGVEAELVAEIKKRIKSVNLHLRKLREKETEALEAHKELMANLKDTLSQYQDLLSKANAKVTTTKAAVAKEKLAVEIKKSSEGASPLINTTLLEEKRKQLHALRTRINHLNRYLADWKAKVNSAYAMGESLSSQGETLKYAVDSSREAKQKAFQHFSRSLTLADQALSKMRASLEEHQIFRSLLLPTSAFYNRAKKSGRDQNTKGYYYYNGKWYRRRRGCENCYTHGDCEYCNEMMGRGSDGGEKGQSLSSPLLPTPYFDPKWGGGDQGSDLYGKSGYGAPPPPPPYSNYYDSPSAKDSEVRAAFGLPPLRGEGNNDDDDDKDLRSPSATTADIRFKNEAGEGDEDGALLDSAVAGEGGNNDENDAMKLEDTGEKGDNNSSRKLIEEVAKEVGISSPPSANAELASLESGGGGDDYAFDRILAEADPTVSQGYHAAPRALASRESHGTEKQGDSQLHDIEDMYKSFVDETGAAASAALSAE
eukprot:jgi/Bigna1/141521/aug1.63_g16229